MRTFRNVEGPISLKGLSIDFLSPVPRPAHDGAVALLLKAKGYTKAPKRKRKKKPGNPCTMKAEEVALAWATWLGEQFAASDHATVKAFVQSFEPGKVAKFDEASVPVVMTSSIDGHAHLLHLHGRAGSSSWQKSEGEENGHDHPFMVTADEVGVFSVEIGDSEGHSHDVDAAALNAAFAAAALSKLHKPEDDMPKPTTTEKTAEQLTSDLELAHLYIGLDDEQRGHFDTLDASAKASFIQLDTVGKAAALKAAKAPEPGVVYKAVNGDVYTDADDPRMVKLAKEADTERKAAQKARDDLDQANLEKRAAAELPHLPGTVQDKAATLKALEAIPDETAKAAALALLKAGDSAIAKGYETFGSSEVDEELGLEGKSAQSQLDALTAKHAAEKGIPIHKATGPVLDTPEGQALYAEIQAGTTNGAPLQ